MEGISKSDYILSRQELRVILGNWRNLRAMFQTLRTAISSYEDASRAIHHPLVETENLSLSGGQDGAPLKGRERERKLAQTMVAPQCGLRRGHSNVVGNNVRPYLYTAWQKSFVLSHRFVGDILLADYLEAMMTFIQNRQNPHRVDIDRLMKSHDYVVI